MTAFFSHLLAFGIGGLFALAGITIGRYLDERMDDPRRARVGRGGRGHRPADRRAARSGEGGRAGGRRYGGRR